jgi:hypothetical protein
MEILYIYKATKKYYEGVRGVWPVLLFVGTFCYGFPVSAGSGPRNQHPSQACMHVSIYTSNVQATMHIHFAYKHIGQRVCLEDRGYKRQLSS